MFTCLTCLTAPLESRHGGGESGKIPVVKNPVIRLRGAMAIIRNRRNEDARRARDGTCPDAPTES